MKKEVLFARAFIAVLLLFTCPSVNAQNRAPRLHPLYRFEYDENGNILKRKAQTNNSYPGGPRYKRRNNYRINVGPNPTTGVFKVENTFPSDEEFTYNLYNTSSVMLETRHSSEMCVQFDISEHAAGVYLLQILGTEYESTWKIIKK